MSAKIFVVEENDDNRYLASQISKFLEAAHSSP